MRNLNYKKLAIKAFQAGKFDLAKIYFSLEFDKTSSKDLLILINICDVAKQSAQEANVLFDMVLSNFDKYKENLNEVIEILESNLGNVVKSEKIQSGIDYQDFKKLVENSGNFKQIFENIMFSTHVVISKRDDLVEFIEHLLENGFDEICFDYLENVAEFFTNTEKISAILNEISKKAKQ